MGLSGSRVPRPELAFGRGVRNRALWRGADSNKLHAQHSFALKRRFSRLAIASTLVGDGHRAAAPNGSAPPVGAAAEA